VPLVIKTKLWAHQEQAVALGYDRLLRYGFLWLDMGCATGKTLTSYALMHKLGVNTALVITTAAAMDSAWETDAIKHLSGVTVVLLNEGNSREKGLLLRQARTNKEPTVIVVNYETAKLIADQIRAADFKLVISDESHKLKGYNSAVSQLLALATRDVRYKIALTGTPWENNPLEVFGQVRWMAPKPAKGGGVVQSKLFGSWTAFFERYAVYHIKDNIKLVDDYKNIDDLRAKIAGFTVMMKTEDIFSKDNPNTPNLPEALFIDRYVEMSPDMRKMYTTLRKDSIAQGDDGIITADNVLELGLRLHQITGGYYQPDDKDDPVFFKGKPAKALAVLDILEEVGGEPVVIFTRFDPDVKLLQDLLVAQGYGVKLLVGGTHEHMEFQRGEGQVLIANIATGAEGVNLNRARYGIFYSVGHSNIQYEQALWRIRRPGMDENKPVSYFRLIMRNTVDETIYRTLSDKGNMADVLERGLLKL